MLKVSHQKFMINGLGFFYCNKIEMILKSYEFMINDCASLIIYTIVDGLSIINIYLFFLFYIM